MVDIVNYKDELDNRLGDSVTGDRLEQIIIEIEEAFVSNYAQWHGEFQDQIESTALFWLQLVRLMFLKFDILIGRVSLT